MKILVVYGTTEGQTRKIAEQAGRYLGEHGAEVTLWDSAGESAAPILEDFDAFIVAASVHHERHQGVIEAFADAHHAILNDRPSAFISVSLSAALEETLPEAELYAERFAALTAWQPAMTLLLGGALRFAEYDYFQQQIVKFIVMKRGLSETGDVEQGEHEFTDWEALRRFLDAFSEAAGAR